MSYDMLIIFQSVSSNLNFLILVMIFEVWLSDDLLLKIQLLMYKHTSFCYSSLYYT